MSGYPDIQVPASLEAWAELNDRYDRLEDENSEEAQRLSDQIKEAWESAPWQDRFRVDWRMLKAVWRERNEQQGNES